MRISVSRESDIPIREQLTAQLVFLIGSGQLKPGDTLPSVRELALRLHVHRNTVSQAYADPSLDALLEKIPGRRVTVRADHFPDPSRPDLDTVINTAIQSAHQHGYTLQQLRQRVQERLRVGPPDHLLLVGREAGMGVILRVELRQRLRVAIDWCTADELTSHPDRALGGLVVSPPALLPRVEPLLPAERSAVRLVYASADEHLDRIRRLPQPSLIVVASVSRYFLETARAVLAPAVRRRHSMEECLMIGDYQDLPQAADLIVCDSVTYSHLLPKRPKFQLIHHQLVSSAFLDEIDAIMADAVTSEVG